MYILGCNRHTNYLHWKITTRSDNCFDQENDSTCCDATTSRQRTCSNGMTSFEKQPPLFRGHVQTQWGHVTKEQLKPVLMQPPLFRGHPGLTNISGTGRWNYLDLDKLKHRKLSLVCLGFTSINVPPMLKCPSPSAFKHIQMSGVTFGGHIPWVLCSVYLD